MSIHNVGFYADINHNYLLNIAKSEQSSHTPGGSHQRPYYFNLLEIKKTGQIKGLIRNMWLILLYTAKTCYI